MKILKPGRIPSVIGGWVVMVSFEKTGATPLILILIVFMDKLITGRNKKLKGLSTATTDESSRNKECASTENWIKSIFLW